MAEKKVTMSVTEFTIVSGKTSTVEVFIDGKKVSIVVPDDVKADFKNQFTRPNPTALQKQKYHTLMRLLAAAYKAGQVDGKK